jgi:hypothetical protein
MYGRMGARNNPPKTIIPIGKTMSKIKMYELFDANGESLDIFSTTLEVMDELKKRTGDERVILGKPQGEKYIYKEYTVYKRIYDLPRTNLYVKSRKKHAAKVTRSKL